MIDENILKQFGFTLYSASSTMGFTIRGYSLNGVYISAHVYNGMGYKTSGTDRIECNGHQIKTIKQLKDLYKGLTDQNLKRIPLQPLNP